MSETLSFEPQIYNLSGYLHTLFPNVCQNCLHLIDLFRMLPGLIIPFADLPHVIQLRVSGITGFDLFIIGDRIALARLNVFPILRTERKGMIQGLFYHPRTILLALSQPRIHVIVAVWSTAFRQAGTYQVRQRGEPVNLADQRIRHGWPPARPRPMHNGWYAGSPLEGTIFVSTQGSHRFVIAQQLGRTVGIAIIHHGSVIARQNN